MICEGELARGDKGLCKECLADPTGDRRGIHRQPFDPRLTPNATADLEFDPTYRDNPHILSWWTPAHDAAIVDLIQEWGWAWPWHARDKICAITRPEVLEAWRESDPICSQYAWYNVLMYFAGSRAQLPQFPDIRPDPTPKQCPGCGHQFIEASLRANQYSFRGAEFCGICLDRAFQNDGDPKASREDILGYLRELKELTQRIPPQAFGTWKDVQGIADTERRAAVLALLSRKPAREAIRREFGSWFQGLIAAGLVEDGSQQMSRGIRSVALDGHVCLSLGERTICDLMYVAGIEHQHEPRYPGSRMRADFLVGTHFVEFLGLAGNIAYDEKTRRKVALAKQQGIQLTLLRQDDLRDLAQLEARLRAMATSAENGGS